ncbi:hypothetical protein AB0E69_03185 [Kribbella sp. NPDC026611]|uniref:hypothetical protein n=1 Tax=Kribbella sp. NPDC026611 TaxID=3154911 RepID=UPI003405801E
MVRLARTAPSIPWLTRSCSYELRHEVEASAVAECAGRLGDGLDEYVCYRAGSDQELEEYARAYESVEEEVGGELLHSMLPTSSWQHLTDDIAEAAGQAADGSVLVSLVFCPPGSLVFQDLERNFSYLNLRSGARWDLHFVGYESLAGKLIEAPSVLGVPLWRFDARRFLSTVVSVETRAPWRYSGDAELVSFMAYQGAPDLVDWQSFRSVSLDRSLGSMVEIMSDWRADRPELRDYAPGEVREDGFSVLQLSSALTKAAGVLAGGVVTNAAYELLKGLLR